MAPLRRVFARTPARLLRRGQVVAELDEASGFTAGGIPQMTGRLRGRPGFWVAPGVTLTFAWQVSPEQRNAAWLEADATIAAVEEGRVTIRGTSQSRPHRRNQP